MEDVVLTSTVDVHGSLDVRGVLLVVLFVQFVIRVMRPQWK